MNKILIAAAVLACSLVSSPLHAGEAVVFLKSKQGDPGQYRFGSLQARNAQGDVVSNLEIAGDDGVNVSIPWASVRAITPRGNALAIQTTTGGKYSLPLQAAGGLVFVGPNEWGGETSFNVSRLVSIEME